MFYSFISQDTAVYLHENPFKLLDILTSKPKKTKKNKQTKISPVVTMGNVSKLSTTRMNVFQFITRAEARGL